MFRKKVVPQSGEREKRFLNKSKYVMEFINGEYKMEKSISKLEK
jgi:hypothetical protein